MIKNITFGSDPEYFVVNESTGKIVSSIPVIDGTKETPESLGDGYFILQDNILAEGNIPPVRTMEMFLNNMHELKRRMTAYIKNKYNVLGLYHADCLDIDTVFLSHPDAMQFGCSPFMNAWDKQVHRAGDLSEETFRTCGFHIHIGYDIDSIWNKVTLNPVITKAFDLFVIIPSCLTHVDQRRFENYGGLGQYRDTSYGVECRSLGGYFVRDELLPWVFIQTMKALDFIQNEENVYKLMYMAKPEAKFKSGIFTFDSSVYNELGISFENQLIKTNKTVHA
jgi:hypothetical protein